MVHDRRFGLCWFDGALVFFYPPEQFTYPPHKFGRSGKARRWWQLSEFNAPFRCAHLWDASAGGWLWYNELLHVCTLSVLCVFIFVWVCGFVQQKTTSPICCATYVLYYRRAKQLWARRVSRIARATIADSIVNTFVCIFMEDACCIMLRIIRWGSAHRWRCKNTN